MPTNAMLSAGHMGIVDAHRYGETRDYATISAALGAIGSQFATLLLPFTGDGVWTINTPVTFPPNVTLYIPAGVTVAGTGAVTIDCQVFSYVDQWYTGSGGLLGQYRTTLIGALESQRIGINHSDPATLLHLLGSGATPPQAAIITVEDGGSTGTAYIAFRNSNLQRGALGLSGSNDMNLTLANTARFLVQGGNVGVGMVPTTQLELSTGGAQKATGTAWSNPSDSRIKTIQSPYTDGLAVVQALEPLWLKYNGLAGTNPDLPQFVSALAQAVQTVAPYMVGTYLAKLHPEDDEDTAIFNFDGSTLLWTLVNAVKELATRVEALESA